MILSYTLYSSIRDILYVIFTWDNEIIIKYTVWYSYIHYSIYFVILISNIYFCIILFLKWIAQARTASQWLFKTCEGEPGSIRFLFAFLTPISLPKQWRRAGKLLQPVFAAGRKHASLTFLWDIINNVCQTCHAMFMAIKPKNPNELFSFPDT